MTGVSFVTMLRFDGLRCAVVVAAAVMADALGARTGTTDKRPAVAVAVAGFVTAM